MRTKYTFVFFIFLSLALILPGFSSIGKTIKASSEGAEGCTLKAAIKKAKAGDTVRLEPGTYRGNFYIEEEISIVGPGPEMVTIKEENERRPIITCDAKLILAGLSIEGGNSAGIKISDGSLLEIRNCKISESSAHGIKASGQSKLLIENSKITSNDWAGLKFSDSTTVTSKNSTFSSNGWAAILLQETAEAFIVNSSIVNNCSGLELWGSSSASITGSTLSENYFAVSPNDKSVVDIEENLIKNNHFGVALRDKKSYNSKDSDYEGRIMGDSNKIINNEAPFYPKELSFLRTPLGGEFGNKSRIPTNYDS